MKNRWTLDAERRLIRVVVRGGAAEPDYVAAIRGVATVTNLTGGYAILADLSRIGDMPDFASLMRMTRALEKLTPPAPNHIALLTADRGAAYGKCRQVVAILTALGISAELFFTEAEALRWLAERQPRLPDAQPAR